MKKPALKIIDNWLAGDEYRRTLQFIRDAGRSIIFANGCFDVLHVGHVVLLNKARGLGWVRKPTLIVGLNRDESVRAIKGEGRPIMPFAARAYHLASLACVDHVIGFAEATPEALIGIMEPAVLVKGSDGESVTVPGAQLVRKKGGVTVFLRAVDGVSTTDVVAGTVGLGGFNYKEL